VGTLSCVSAEREPDSEHFQCPFCNSYDVDRLYVGAVNVDSCACASCGARWDEQCSAGRNRYVGRADSVLLAAEAGGAGLAGELGDDRP